MITTLSSFTHFRSLRSEFSVSFWFWSETESEWDKIFFLWNETESVFFWWDETESDFFLWDETESDFFLWDETELNFFSWDETKQKTEAVLMRQDWIFVRQNVSFWFFDQSNYDCIKSVFCFEQFYYKISHDCMKWNEQSDDRL